MVAQGCLAENSSEGSEGMVVQLGDVGSGPTSGSTAAFEAARHYLKGFDLPYNLILGEYSLGILVALQLDRSAWLQ